MNKKVCHLSSAHRGLDTRIYLKECLSLVKAGYETHLVIQATTEQVERAKEAGVFLHRLAPPKSRLSRMLGQARKCYKIGKLIDADIYHIHDPELLPYAIFLSIKGKKVIYDVHEDLPRDILSKEWIPFWARKLVSLLASCLEFIAAKWFLSVITATPFIATRFKKINSKSIDINNYPILGELALEQINWANKQNHVAYIGGITQIRGILEVVAAMEHVSSCVLQLGGSFSEKNTEEEVKKLTGWSNVNELGFVNRQQVAAVLAHSVAGIVTFLPAPNHIDAQPNKMFEYMSAGIPVIASNFPLWREIIEGNQCGICVDPLKPKDIATVINYLINNPVEAEKMGSNGQRAVVEKYNWGEEEKKLLALYTDLL